jgi:hypothetical protein
VRKTDRCIELADGFLIPAEKELSAFVRAVDKLFGAGAGPAIGAGLDRGTGTYGLAVWGIDSRLASGYRGRKCSPWRFVVWRWRASTWQARKEIPVSKCCLRCTTLSAATWKRGLVDIRKTRGPQIAGATRAALSVVHDGATAKENGAA